MSWEAFSFSFLPSRSSSRVTDADPQPRPGSRGACRHVGRIVGPLAVALVARAFVLPASVRTAGAALPPSGGQEVEELASQGDRAADMAAIPARGRAAAKQDSTKHRSPPFRVMLRSAAVPGWGQVYNHKYWKAAL